VNQHVLLTGACGFVGKTLLPMLQAKGCRVTCTSTSASSHEDSAADWVTLDINDAAAVSRVLEQVKPSHVVHLAAQSHVPRSFREPAQTWQTNVMGTLHLLEAVKKHCCEAFFLFISSSEVYGESFKAAKLLGESVGCMPMNPYAASKRAAELAVEQYFRQGLAGVIARPFNHIGPGQSPDFVTASFAKQIAAIEAGKQKPILQVGNLEAQRDFLDVKDVCTAYLALLELNTADIEDRVFNIASGQPRRIDDVLKLLLQQSSQKIAIEQDPEHMRPSDISLAAGNCTRIRELTGWQASYDLSSTLSELLNYWRMQAERL
jgi:GDP-4-dehydro-6-deoxy-D-mannose reductase